MLKHHGKNMPVEADKTVRVLQRNGSYDKAKAREFNWVHRLDHDGKPWGGDIVSYEEVASDA